MLPTLSPRQKAGLAVALALLLWAPLGVSHGDSTMIVAHTTFYNGDTFSPCLASLAGIMRHRVMWFNDQVLVETYGGKGTFIYITEAEADDPRARQLRSEGVFYDFVDPNGAHWHVQEAYMSNGIQGDFYVNDDPSNPNAPGPRVTIGRERTYVWIVELASRPIYDEFNGDDPHSYYNFVSLVDTCKMHNNTETYDGEEYHTLENNTLRPGPNGNGHRATDEDHHHGRYMVDIWVGKRPTIIPMGVDSNATTYQTQWAGSTVSGEGPQDPAEPDNGMAELP